MAWKRKVDAPFCVPGTNTLGAHWKLACALAASEALEPSGLRVHTPPQHPRTTTNRATNSMRSVV